MYYLRQFVEMLLYPLRAMLMSPGKLATGARKLAAISLPARISILVAVFMILAAIAGYIAFRDLPQAASFWQENWFIIPGLILVIPIVLYWVLRLWLEGERSRYPDIDRAWQAGLAALRAQGLDLSFTPLFLVLGSSGEALERVVFHAAEPLRLREIPPGQAALHWYAGDQGVFLVCTEVGCLSRLSALAFESARDAKILGGGRGPRPSLGELRGTMMLEPEMTAGNEPADSPEATEATTAEAEPPKMAVARQNLRGTIVSFQDSQGDDEPVAPVEPTRKPVLLSQEVQREQELRLEYLCQLIAKARQPLAPANGILTLLPYSTVQTGRREGTELQRVINRDLAMIARTFKLRCPVVSLVVGLEEETGFRELVRRLPREVVVGQRFGKGYPPSNTSIQELEKVAAHACGLFEAKVYELFREKGSLDKPGNRKLYSLLCKIRRTVRVPLAKVLMYGYAQDPEANRDPDAPPMFFSGCYFAAAGDTQERQAFIKGVLEKLPDEQEELEWTDAAWREENSYRGWSQAVMWLDFLLLVGLAAMIALKIFRA